MTKFAKIVKSNDIRGARVGKIFPLVGNKSGWTRFTLDSGEEGKLRSSFIEIVEGESLEEVRNAPAGGAFDRLKAARVKYNKVKEGGKDQGVPVRLRVDCGDDVAAELRPLTLDKVYSTVAKEVGVTAKSLHERYSHLNLGQQRMNLGNMLRRVRGAEADA